MEQAHRLMEQAEGLRRQEVQQAIDQAKEIIKSYGLTAEDLGLGKKAKAKKTGRVKYRGPNGETWSGGPGRRPQWIQEAVKAGKSIEEFAVA
jgi:DNA-binding protein H-NS